MTAAGGRVVNPTQIDRGNAAGHLFLQGHGGRVVGVGSDFGGPAARAIPR